MHAFDPQICPTHHAGNNFYYVMGKLGIPKNQVPLYGMRLLVCAMEFNNMLWILPFWAPFDYLLKLVPSTS
jgi:hypothetical protein